MSNCREDRWAQLRYAGLRRGLCACQSVAKRGVGPLFARDVDFQSDIGWISLVRRGRVIGHFEGRGRLLMVSPWLLHSVVFQAAVWVSTLLRLFFLSLVVVVLPGASFVFFGHAF